MTSASALVRAVSAVAVLVTLAWGCATPDSEELPSRPAAATPCPGLANWPPTALPAPPPSIAIGREPDGGLQAVNHGITTVKVAFRVWTPGDCDRMPMGVPDTFGPTLLAPGKSMTLGDSEVGPRAGPVMGGIEVWTHLCDVACGDPPDSFLAIELRRAVPGG